MQNEPEHDTESSDLVPGSVTSRGASAPNNALRNPPKQFRLGERGEGDGRRLSRQQVGIINKRLGLGANHAGRFHALDEFSSGGVVDHFNASSYAVMWWGSQLRRPRSRSLMNGAVKCIRFATVRNDHPARRRAFRFASPKARWSICFPVPPHFEQGSNFILT